MNLVLRDWLTAHGLKASVGGFDGSTHVPHATVRSYFDGLADKRPFKLLSIGNNTVLAAAACKQPLSRRAIHLARCVGRPAAGAVALTWHRAAVEWAACWASNAIDARVGWEPEWQVPSSEHPAPMALCKFTSTEAGKPPIYVNPAVVFLIRRVGANTYIITESGTKVTVAEPLEEVVARLDAHLPAN